MKIREAEIYDLDALQGLYLRHLTQTPPERQNRDAWDAQLSQLLADENYHILVGEAEGAVIASVTLIIIPNLTHGLRPYALIENVVTHADFRGRGCASELMHYAAELAKQANCYKIMLLTGSKEESTLRFYEHCGYNRQTKTGFHMAL